ncbi:MAG: hypothetical protein HQL29_05780, partial [Candidatus Omnitrophica bacterium]|nr:hypothetical protein [Candidatus Omnitrophota bacterium]
MLCGIFFLFFSANRKVSAYEYVRKAAKYFEDDKYEKGLNFLGKAYENAQKNPEIIK